jgi:hypothetical protein
MPGETATLSDITEVTGPGYERVGFNTGVTDFPELILSNGDWMVTSILKPFAAVGGDWTEAEFGFLTDVATGTVGECFALVNFAAFTNFDGNSFDVAVEYQDA